MTKFISANNNVVYFLIVAVISVLLIIFISNFSTIVTSLIANPNATVVYWLVPFVILSAYAIFLIWILKSTNYYISDNYLACKSGPFRIKIAIEKIKKVEENDSWIKTTIFKPALSHKGFYIYYDRYECVFVSPQNKKLFAFALKEINPNIQFI